MSKEEDLPKEQLESLMDDFETKLNELLNSKMLDFSTVLNTLFGLYVWYSCWSVASGALTQEQLGEIEQKLARKPEANRDLMVAKIQEDLQRE